MANSPFLQLPLEVKTQIYGYLLTCDGYRINPQSDGTNPPTHPQLYPQILATNKQVNGEATGVLYDGNPWIVVSISMVNQLTEREIRVPRLAVPDPIKKRLQSPSKAPGLILCVHIDDGSPKDTPQQDQTSRTTIEFMLDLRNFSRLCRLSLDDFFLMDRCVCPAFDYRNAHVEKIARFYTEVMGCLGEANGRNYAPSEPNIMRNGTHEIVDGEGGPSDFILLSGGCYDDLDPLLCRMDYYEKEACRLEKIGECQAAQCLRLDCLELAAYGGNMWYNGQEMLDELVEKKAIKQLLDRIMSIAILCATSSLEIGNTEMIACVQRKVQTITTGGTYSLDDFSFKPTSDYRVVMEQCSWRMLRDQHMKGPVTGQELQQMTTYRRRLPPGGDPWGTFTPVVQNSLVRHLWPDAASFHPVAPSTMDEMISLLPYRDIHRSSDFHPRCVFRAWE